MYVDSLLRDEMGTRLRIMMRRKAKKRKLELIAFT
jgi:hypothetical protein